MNQSVAPGKNGFAPASKAPAIRSISRGPIGGTRSISASRFESARSGQLRGAAPVAKAAPKEPLPAAQPSSAPTSSAAAPVAAQELAGGVVSVADQIRSLYESASTILPQYKNDYQQVLKMDITDMEKGKVADNLVRTLQADNPIYAGTYHRACMQGKIKAKREAVAFMKAALTDCIERRATGMQMLRTFESVVKSKLEEAVMLCSRNDELQTMVAERDQRIAELETEKIETEQGLEGQKCVTLEMEDAYQKALDRIAQLEQDVQAYDERNKEVEDAKVLADGQVEELQAELDALRKANRERESSSHRLQSERQQLSVEITSIQDKVKKLERELQKMTDERDKFKSSAEQYKEEATSAQSNLRVAQATAQDYLARTTEMSTSFMTKQQQLLEQINKMDAETRVLRDTVEESGRQIRCYKDSEAELTKQLASTRTTLAHTEATVATTTAQLQQRTAEVAELTQVNDQLNAKAGQLLDAETKVSRLLESEKVWKEKEAQWSAERETLVQKVQDLSDSKESLESELAGLKSTMGATAETLQAQIAALNRERSELGQKQRNNAQLSKSLKATEAELRRVNDDLFSSEMERRKLHNMIQELKGNIRVYVRVRPFLSSDADPAAARAQAGLLEDDEDGAEDEYISTDPTPAISVAPDGTFLDIVPPPDRIQKAGMPGAKKAEKPLRFNFDHVFGQRSGQEDVFNEVCHLVQSGTYSLLLLITSARLTFSSLLFTIAALDGYNVCLFSYGQTGSGKTHTMQGTSGDPGLIPRSVKKILDTVEYMTRQGWSYTVEASFLEIYNESLRDLLRDPKKAAGAGAGAGEVVLTVHQDTAGNTDVPGLTRLPIADARDVDQLLAAAAKRRAVAATSMNAQSSRSHSVFTLHVRGEHAGKAIAVTGALNLVDLAGSERLDRSKAEGDRKKETAAINKSLSCLADVFTALAKKASHVPFRNSKLTHLLQPCFRGDGKTLMLVNLSPTMASAFESGCSVRFAAQVSQVEVGKGKKKVEVLEDAPQPVSAAAPSKAMGMSSTAAIPAARSAGAASAAPVRLVSTAPIQPSSALNTSAVASDYDAVNSSRYTDGEGMQEADDEDEDGLEDETDMHTLGMPSSSAHQPLAYAGLKRPVQPVSSSAAAPRAISAAPPAASAGMKRPAGAVGSNKPTAPVPGVVAKKPRFGTPGGR